MVIKRISCGIIVMSMMGTMMMGSVPAGNRNNIYTSTVITAEAAKITYKPGMRSGSRSVYVSKIGITSNALTITGNSDDDVEYMISWLDTVSNACSGGKPAASVIKTGKDVLSFFGVKKSIVLTVFEKIFSSLGGVSSSASRARKELISLTNKYPLQGFKVTLRQDGNWIVETQAASKDLEKAYKDYINQTSNCFVEGQTYIFKNTSGGVYIGTASNKIANKVNVQAVTSKSNATQFVAHYDKAVNGWIFRAKKNKSLVLNFYADKVVSGCNVCLYQEQKKDKTQYIIPKKKSGKMILTCAANEKVAIEISGYISKAKNGTNIRGFSVNNDPSQEWSAIKV